MAYNKSGKCQQCGKGGVYFSPRCEKCESQNAQRQGIYCRKCGIEISYGTLCEVCQTTILVAPPPRRWHRNGQRSIAMNIILFSTMERGPDHGPVFFMKTPHSKATEVARNEYLAMMELPGEWLQGEYHATVSQTPQDGAEATNGKRVVLVQGLNGQRETDAEFMARQAELADYRQTVDAASYRNQ